MRGLHPTYATSIGRGPRTQNWRFWILLGQAWEDDGETGVSLTVVSPKRVLVDTEGLSAIRGSRRWAPHFTRFRLSRPADALAHREPCNFSFRLLREDLPNTSVFRLSSVYECDLKPLSNVIAIPSSFMFIYHTWYARQS